MLLLMLLQLLLMFDKNVLSKFKFSENGKLKQLLFMILLLLKSLMMPLHVSKTIFTVKTLLILFSINIDDDVFLYCYFVALKVNLKVIFSVVISKFIKKIYGCSNQIACWLREYQSSSNPHFRGIRCSCNYETKKALRHQNNQIRFNEVKKLPGNVFCFS